MCLRSAVRAITRGVRYIGSGLRGGQDQRGSFSLELAILAPIALMIIGTVIYAGRLELARQSVEQAAETAAREASLARTATYARSAAGEGARRALAEQGLECTSVSAVVDTSAFATAIGTPGNVTTRVTCVVSSSDLLLPGVPGSRTVTATATSPLDSYRGRQ